MVRRLALAVAGVLLAGVLAPLPAHGQPTTDVEPTLTTTAHQLGRPSVAGTLTAPKGAGQDELGKLARRRAITSTSGGGRAVADVSPGKRQALAAASPPAEPDPSFAQECEASRAAANDKFGYVKNRYQWCTTNIVTAVEVDPDTPSGNGSLEMTFVLVGYGRDDGTRNITVFMRPMTVFGVGSLGPQTSVDFDIECLHSTPGCGTTSSHRATVAEWLARSVTGSWVSIELSSDESASTLNDKLLYHPLAVKLKIRGTDTVYVREADNSVSEYWVRCDSATYFPGRPKACVFYDVIPHLQYALLNADGSKTPEHAVAEHIRDAFAYPNATYPLKIDGPKRIPGNYQGATLDDRLQRVPYDSPDHIANGKEKDRACNRVYPYTDTGLEVPPVKDVEQCDEFPFATTVQGAVHPDWDFSVRAVPKDDNRDAGIALQDYYKNDRILYYDDDLFFVEILPVRGGGSGGGGGGPVSNLSVSAGPDVTGDEGRPLQLRGWVDSPFATPQLTWSVAGEPGNDPGASCSFDDPHVTRPKLTCNDDGTFVATLTATNGVDQPASDSTRITVRNAPPEVGITSPRPWQVLRAGQPLHFEAPFTDAANDTHTCEVLWDDGRTETFAPTQRTCDTTHTYPNAGMYTIKVAVTDDDGATGTAEVLLIVYDPNGGWANIDGSTVTDGSLLSDHGATGSTWVHATARYYSASNPPTGLARAWVENSDFRLEPSTLEWMVVTPSNRVALKGTGTVGGRAGYGYLLYGLDNPDRVRLVVWRLDDTGIPRTGFLYDSAAGDSFDVDRISSRPMTSGQVLVQR